jgi:branched-chain amino acid transport system substrate-binding protein
VRHRKNWQGQVSLTMLLLVAAIALTACGSSSSSTSSSSTSSSATSASQGAATSTASSAPKTSGAAFSIGFVCSCTGAEASVYGETGAVATAWAQNVNATGGIDGHPVKVTVLDDGLNPATALENVKKLVEQDHVQAIVDSSLADASFAPYIKAQGIPVLAGENAEPTFIDTPGFYATGPTIPVQFTAIAAVAKQAGKTALGLMICTETPGCKQVVPLLDEAAKLNGLKSATTSISASSPNYLAPCLLMKNQGIDALFVGENGQTVQRVMDDCAQQSYKPIVDGPVGTLVPAWLKDANFDGALLVSPAAIFTDTSQPAVAAFKAALTKYAPSVVGNAAFTQQTLNPWIGESIFEAAAKAGHLTPSSSPADVTKALGLLKNETLGGLIPPITITPGKPVFTPCYFAATVKNGALQALNGNKPVCLPQKQVAALTAAG